MTPIKFIPGIEKLAPSKEVMNKAVGFAHNVLTWKHAQVLESLRLVEAAVDTMIEEDKVARVRGIATSSDTLLAGTVDRTGEAPGTIQPPVTKEDKVVARSDKIAHARGLADLHARPSASSNDRYIDAIAA